MGPKRSQYCLYHIPHFMEDHKHCLKPSFVLRLWMVSRRGRGGELCAKVEGFHAVEILWGGMSRALQQWPSLVVTGVTLIIPCGNILRCFKHYLLIFFCRSIYLKTLRNISVRQFVIPLQRRVYAYSVFHYDL